MVAEARAITELPPDIERLLVTAREEGHYLVSRLVDEWEDGTNRFDLPGEVLAEMRCDRSLCAIGGLNVDPYLEDPTVGRIRHVFVHPSHRRCGVGQALVGFLLDHAANRFRRVRLRSDREPGPQFYAALGFVTTEEPNATHEVLVTPHP